ncbi:MAG: alanine racemase, partial [Planctomycetes bacterium]|nr:alanine racemase [Planctomycetota bacterium]
SGGPVPVWIKLDAGYGRAGVHWRDERRLRQVLNTLQAPWIELRGLLAHNGHSYDARSRAQVAEVHAQCLERLIPLRERYADIFSGGRCQLSIGDTPSCSLLDDFGPVDEIRPGNFVFYDLSQVQIGACTREQIAASVICPVIGKDEANQRMILHGGAVHLSKDWMELADGSHCFGEIAARPFNGEWQQPDPERRLSSLSQEHGIVQLPAGTLSDYRIGDFVQVFPVHSCLACDLHSGYRELGGASLSRVR